MYGGKRSSPYLRELIFILAPVHYINHKLYIHKILSIESNAKNTSYKKSQQETRKSYWERNEIFPLKCLPFGESGVGRFVVLYSDKLLPFSSYIDFLVLLSLGCILTVISILWYNLLLLFFLLSIFFLAFCGRILVNYFSFFFFLFFRCLFLVIQI